MVAGKNVNVMSSVYREYFMFQDLSLREKSHASAPDSQSKNLVTLKDGERVNLVKLDSAWINPMIDLQEKTSAEMTIPRDRNFLEKLFSQGDSAFGFITNDKRLIAQATLRLNTDLPSILTAHFNNAADKHALIGLVITDPDYAGQNLMSHLIDHCLKEAKTRNMQHVHAWILANPKTDETANPACMHNFRDKFKFSRLDRGQSPHSSQKRIVDFMGLTF